jgi:hypothetical protein
MIAVQRVAKPNEASPIEYVTMPGETSSEAPSSGTEQRKKTFDGINLLLAFSLCATGPLAIRNGLSFGTVTAMEAIGTIFAH